MRKFTTIILDDPYTENPPDPEKIRKWFEEINRMDNVTIAYLEKAAEELERMHDDLHNLALRLDNTTPEWRSVQLSLGFVRLARVNLPVKLDR